MGKPDDPYIGRGFRPDACALRMRPHPSARIVLCLAPRGHEDECANRPENLEALGNVRRTARYAGAEFWGDRMLREMRERSAQLKREWQDAQAALALRGIVLPDREAFWLRGAKATFHG